MKQNKKGFTLIELLAVIVILAIIALIATPIILNMINDAKKSAAKDSAYGYMKSVDNYIALAAMSTTTGGTTTPIGKYNPANLPKGYDTAQGVTCTKGATDANNCAAFFTAIDSTVKGTRAEDNSTITIANGAVSSATLKMDGFTVNIDAQGNASMS